MEAWDVRTGLPTAQLPWVLDSSFPRYRGKQALMAAVLSGLPEPWLLPSILSRIDIGSPVSLTKPVM